MQLLVPHLVLFYHVCLFIFGTRLAPETFDTRRNQLTRQGFMELHLMEATEKDGDPSDLWLTLEAMGYNQALELVEASSKEPTRIFNHLCRY
jgi:hypothetical protein